MRKIGCLYTVQVRSKHRQRDETQVQSDASLLSKYLYKKGDSDQEVDGVRVSINESGVRKSDASQSSYSKRGEIVTLPPS